MSEPAPQEQAFSQLSPHGGRRIELAGRYGPIAALAGPAPADPIATVLLLPGYTGSKEDFAPLLGGIAGGGFRPVAVDLPGQYESPGPDDESLYLPAALGEVVAELIGRLAEDGPPVLLLGHSYGGLVARGAVLAGAPLAGLTLLDSGPGRLPDGARLHALVLGEPLMRAQGVDAAYALRERLDTRVPGHAAELKEFLRTRFVASSAAGLLGIALALRTEPDRVAETAEVLRRREVRRLVVAGEHDDAWSVPAQRDMARRLDAPFAVVEGAGHSPNTENPAGLLEILLRRWRSWFGTSPAPAPARR
ncbi:alpha/beta fold hydrolase [Qaidamihabitans albus]|uniref:alpha/beta fold hydrolase n=1 Tax=Qaidamihabitans albus TaxID=2795733 RepID=UPI0018F1388B|nr:alpha/beta hydrolase [Qaidamihabitans albus]